MRTTSSADRQSTVHQAASATGNPTGNQAASASPATASRHTARKRARPPLVRRRPTPPGTAPGTLTADPAAHGTRVSALVYDSAGVVAHDGLSAEQAAALRQSEKILWLDVVGLADTALIGRLGTVFGLHPLALEDVVNVHQRPKAEDFDDTLYVVVRMLRLVADEANDRSAPMAGGGRDGPLLDSEQVSLFLGRGFVITFQERPGDCFDGVRERLASGRTRIRSRGADYLAYALLDAITDHLFPVAEAYGERLEAIEDQVLTEPSARPIQVIHAIKRDLLMIRRAVWPERDALAALARGHDLITEQTQLYLRDCHDHTVQLMDMVETYRDVASGLVELTLSSLSHSMNQVMKVLTVI
ncbi:MAG: magnesium/cobalt transporter CorA, partial [Alphaproteobacteria bacterium]